MVMEAKTDSKVDTISRYIGEMFGNLNEFHAVFYSKKYGYDEDKVTDFTPLWRTVLLIQMDKPRPCGCKGRRSCLICEEQYNIEVQSPTNSVVNSFDYCHYCGEAWEFFKTPRNEHPNHRGSKFIFPGVFIQHNFLSESEKETLLEGINNDTWSLSQSGRRKQNYGPRCNFKKRKIQTRDFYGFPKYSEFVHDRFKTVPLLKDFHVIEQCVLEYDPKRGASIDPHIDDCWIWGERIVTVNVLGDTFLTLTKYKGDKSKYNLNCVESEESEGARNRSDYIKTSASENAKVRIYMPEKSLIVLYGNARYEWEHFIPREDIKEYRLCIAYREFTKPYLCGEFQNIGNEILEIAKQFR